MKKVVFYLICILLTTATIDVQAHSKSSNKGYKKSGSSVYSGKKYKGHKCPPKRKIINAIYF
jgi:hypothetical protein